MTTLQQKISKRDEVNIIDTAYGKNDEVSFWVYLKKGSEFGTNGYFSVEGKCSDEDEAKLYEFEDELVRRADEILDSINPAIENTFKAELWDGDTLVTTLEEKTTDRFNIWRYKRALDVLKPNGRLIRWYFNGKEYKSTNQIRTSGLFHC